jgi:pyridoxamine 5'-phosphate oxidase
MSEEARHEDLRERLRSLEVFAGALDLLDVSEAPTHPADLFLDWLIAAIDAGVAEPHAMTLSTVDAQGRPSSRVLILKGLSDGRWEFAGSRLSRKGTELQVNPWAALGFYWREQGRQVRIRGQVLPAGQERSAADFLARSTGARAEALAGTQSEVLEDRDELEEALRSATRRLEADPGLVAEEWTLYGLIAEEVEFWQADRERRHTRLRYRLVDGLWRREQLWP